MKSYLTPDPHSIPAEPMHASLRDRVHSRARELALLAGRVPPTVAQQDYEQAKREITGESELERQDRVLEHEAETKPSGSS